MIKNQSVALATTDGGKQHQGIYQRIQVEKVLESAKVYDAINRCGGNLSEFRLDGLSVC